MDWAIVGKIDGELNRPESFLKEHRSSCPDEFDKTKWLEGYKSGKEFYCTAPGAYMAGRDGASFPNQCPKETLTELQKAFQDGKNVRHKNAEYSQLSQDLAEAKEAEKKKASQKSSFTQDLGRYLFPTELRSKGLEESRSKVFEEKNQIEAKYPPPPTIYRSDSERAYNFVGAGVGTFFGFGLGYPFQGRYSSRGWWYTVGEIGVFFIPGGGAIIGFLTAKVIESWDVWNYANQQSMGYPNLKD